MILCVTRTTALVRVLEIDINILHEPYAHYLWPEHQRLMWNKICFTIVFSLVCQMLIIKQSEMAQLRS